VSRIRWVVVGVVVALVLVGAGAALARHRDVTVDAERAAALKAAHQVQASVHGTFLVATYRPDAGEKGPSNTGHPCRSGATVEVRLVWKSGASFTHGGVPGGRPDGPRQALIVTADAVNGVPCLIGASYRDVRPRPGEIYLYGPRKDLVSSR
jgi:hypothetical protein